MTILELLQQISYAQTGKKLTKEDAFDKCLKLFQHLQSQRIIYKEKTESYNQHGRQKSSESHAYTYTLSVKLFPNIEPYTITKRVTCLKMLTKRLVTCHKLQPAAVAAIIMNFSNNRELVLQDPNRGKEAIVRLEYRPGIVENVLAYMSGKPLTYVFQVTKEMHQQILLLYTSIDYSNPNIHNHIESELEKITDWHFELDKDIDPRSFLKALKEVMDPKSALSSQTIDKKLLDKIREYPVYDSLLQENRIQELRSFLSLNCILSINAELEITVNLRWTINSFLTDIENALAEVIQKTCYTKADLFSVLGELAKRASDVYGENMDFADLYSVKIIDSIDDSFFEEHWEELELAVLAGLIKITSDMITFTHKRFRIIFSAINKAQRDNRLPLSQVSFDLEKYREDRNSESHQGHLSKRYNWATVYFTIYAEFLNSDKREAFFTALFSYALEYKTGYYNEVYDRRELQMKAIQIISYYLYAGTSFPYKKELALFQAAYGENLYSMQAIIINEFLEKRPYYQTVIRESFKKACHVTNGIADAQPNYIFLQCLFPFETKEAPWLGFFRTASIWHDRTYRQLKSHEIKKIKYEFLFAEIVSGGGILKRYYWKMIEKAKPVTVSKDEMEKLPLHAHSIPIEEVSFGVDESNILWYVYGLQLYAYMFGNHLLNMDTYGVNLSRKLTENKDMAEQIVESFIYADYFCRKMNPQYQFGNYYEKHATTEKMFLLCGPIRFFCHYRTVDKKVLLPESMKQDYLRWLEIENREYPRYSFLLLNVLCHTDVEYSKLIPPYYEFSKISFLPYDHMETNYDELYARLRKC